MGSVEAATALLRSRMVNVCAVAMERRHRYRPHVNTRPSATECQTEADLWSRERMSGPNVEPKAKRKPNYMESLKIERLNF